MLVINKYFFAFSSLPFPCLNNAAARPPAGGGTARQPQWRARDTPMATRWVGGKARHGSGGILDSGHSIGMGWLRRQTMTLLFSEGKKGSELKKKKLVLPLSSRDSGVVLSYLRRNMKGGML